MAELMYSLDAKGFAAFRADHAAAVHLPRDGRRKEATRNLRRARIKMVIAFSEQWLVDALGEQQDIQSLSWFWFNHFNVYWGRPLVGAALPDYLQSVIRPNVMGRFRDLLMAVMTHPAMLVYLDNARNVVGRINENYARELLELHTLGVTGGYEQQDVQNVALILTGLGLRPVEEIQWPERLEALVRKGDLFLFDPRRHDFSDKTVLGQVVKGQGFGEIEFLCDLLAAHPATARHISERLAQYLVGEGLPPDILEKATATYLASNGDISAVVTELHAARDSLGKQRKPVFKDAYRWMMSAIRLLSGDYPVRNTKRILKWLTALGEPLFGCRTPDGYSLRSQDWINSGQMVQRFELANEMVMAMPRVTSEDWMAERVLASSLVRELEQRLLPDSRAVIEAVEDPSQRLILLISSPEFMYW